MKAILFTLWLLWASLVLANSVQGESPYAKPLADVLTETKSLEEKPKGISDPHPKSLPNHGFYYVGEITIPALGRRLSCSIIQDAATGNRYIIHDARVSITPIGKGGPAQ